MNIMLVTCLQNVPKKLDCEKLWVQKKRDILAQFLVESSVLSLVGVF